METKSQRLKRRDDGPASLDAAISALDLSRGISNVTPVGNIFSSASHLLKTIKVRLFLPTFVNSWLMYAGLGDQRSGLCGTGASLRRYMSSTRSGDGTAQQNRPGGDRAIDNVS